MTKERQLGKFEASVGLSLIACLLVALGAAIVYRIRDEAPPVADRVSGVGNVPVEPTAIDVQQTSYQPAWLPSSDKQPAPRPLPR
jgi:hypothetical protein